MTPHPFRPDWATHPGEHLAEYLEARGLTQTEFARIAGITSQLVGEIVAKKARVTTQTALIFERVLGLNARVWIGLQQHWDEHQARQQKL